MSATESPVYRFAGFELEPAEWRLSREGAVVPLTPKAFELLVLLVRAAGRVISKDELMAALWPGRFVMESNLTKHVWQLRKILDGDAEQDGCIETVSKVGYRFVAPVSEGRADAAPARSPPSQTAGPVAPRTNLLAFASRRRLWWIGLALAAGLAAASVWLVAVRGPGASSGDPQGTAVSMLGFDNLSRNPEDSWIGPALAETLGTEISLAGRLRVIPGELSRPAQAGLPAPGVGGYARASLLSLRQRLGADFVVSGGYLVLGNGEAATVRLDIAVQNTRDGAIVSLSRSGSVAELPALVTLIGGDLRRDLGARLGAGEDQSLAVNLQPPTAEVMRHMGYGLDALHRYDAARARDEFLDAVAQAPAYAPAYAYLAQAWTELGYQAKARAAAEQAGAYAGDLPASMRLQIEAQRQSTAFDWRGAIATLRRLIALRPGDPEWRLQLIDALIKADRPSEAATALSDLRAFRGAKDPRFELAAARVAAAREDSIGVAQHAAATLAQARVNDEIGLVADAETQLGITLGDRDPQAADQKLQAALADYRRMGNPRGEAWAQQNLGNLYMEKDPPRARAAYERALAGYQGIGDMAGAANVSSDMAIMLWNAGDRDAAETAARRVLEIRRQTEDLSGQAWALTALAIAAADESAGEAVIAEFRQAIDLDVRAGAQGHRAFSLLSLSDVLRVRGDLPGATKTCAQSQAIYGGGADPTSRHLADFECAQIALDRGDIGAAGAEAKSAGALAQARGDVMTAGNAELLEGQIALGQRHFRQAAAELDAARSKFAGAEMVSGEAVANGLLALSLAELNRPQARDAAAARAAQLRGRVTARQEVFAADIAAAQLRGGGGEREQAAAALQALAADAGRRQWLSLSLEARLAAVEVLSRGGETVRSRAWRQALTGDARRGGFGWVLQRLNASGESRS